MTTTLIGLFEDWVQKHPDRCLYSFLDGDGEERDSYTYLAFHERTRHLAEHLARRVGLRRGDRVLLVYPPGLEIMAAFFACARIGVIPVPVYPPAPLNFDSGLSKLAFVAEDCGARVALTTRGFFGSYRLQLAKRGASSIWPRGRVRADLDWVTTDDARGVASAAFRNDPGEILFLQYTSGSTSEPKGVVVTHDNVVHNGLATLDHEPVCVSWLPQYHDMGLVGYYLYPAMTGGTTYGFSPMDFLKRPSLWLRTISRVRATYTSAPNFGFEHCLGEERVPAAQLEGVDLGSLRVMMNAAEPVRADTYTRFFERFAGYGLRREAHVVAYGLAENTLCVTNHGRQVLTVNKRLLQQQRLHIENDQPRNNNQSRLVSCGRPLGGVEVRIVQPETGAVLGEKEVGEIWLAGRSVCRGYWNRPALTAEVFGATAADGTGPYMRTGDLGFFYEGELVVCGRIKDMIIIRGVNYYPHDIEAIVEASSSRIRAGAVAAINADEEGEALALIVEVRTPADLPDPHAIARAVRSQYYIEPHTIAFVPPRSIARTTSGKTARALTRRRWLDGDMTVIAKHVSVREAQPAHVLPGLRGRFQYLLELYNLTGEEGYSFAELGVDSLTMVQLIDDIKGVFEEQAAGGLVEHVDVKLLQRLTVAEFFALLRQFEEAPGKPAALLRRVLRKVQEEQEAYERECMRADAVLGLEPSAQGAPPAAIENVLVTGTTGFFGPFLIESLLRQTDHTLFALVRATDAEHGRERIRAGLRRSRLWTPALEDAFARRVRVVCGDISRHNLGMKSGEWEALAASIHAVVHNGALVNYVLSYDALRPHNVDATRELLRFALTGVRKQFHHISSTFIYGWTVKPRLFETDDNDAMEMLDFGYSQSKWVAEQLVFAAARQGLDARVYRSSIISASTGSVGGRDDIAVRLITFMINHSVAVSALNQLSFLPADIAADNIVAIMDQPGTEGRTFNVTVDGYYNMMDVTRTITRDYGYTFDYYPIPEFVAEMNRRATPADPIYPLLDFFNRAHRKFMAMAEKRYVNDGYRRARDASPAGRADPTVTETVRYMVEFMLREGLIAARPPARAEAPAPLTVT